MNLRNQIGLKTQVESILLLGGDEIKIKDLCKFFSLSLDKMLLLLQELKNERKGTGINIEMHEELVYLVTNPICGEVINKYFEQDAKPKKLSGASLETLSIIAYNQPVTKTEIEAIRGVSVDKIIQNLENKKFIVVCGKRESIGRPNLYEITDKFLGYLGIDSVNELPNYEETKEKISGRNKN
nr:SMC-Scp complex subunit ScpB [Cetobacterium sp. 2A]